MSFCLIKVEVLFVGNKRDSRIFEQLFYEWLYPIEPEEFRLSNELSLKTFWLSVYFPVVSAGKLDKLLYSSDLNIRQSIKAAMIC